MQVFLKKLEEAIKIHLKETYLPPHRAKTPEWTYHDLKFFAKGAEMASTAFTEGRSELPKNYFNKKEFRSAYLLYFVLTNAAKVWKCLEQMTSEGASSILLAPSDRPLKILDLGCGPATASLACSAFFKDRPLEILGFEQNEGIKRDALSLWKQLAKTDHRFAFTRYAIPNERFDLVIAANFLSELSFGEQVNISTSALQHTSTLIIIEPALQKTTRALMALRDRLVESRAGQVLAPCLHQQNCPMLKANKRDWCHFYISWKCPEVIRQADQLVGNKHDYLKMAYMIFTTPKGARSILLAPFGSGWGRSTSPIPLLTKEGGWRVVSSPLISNGKKELILCGDCGLLKKITRLDKNRADQNASIDQIRRGDIINWDGENRVKDQDKTCLLKKF